MSRSQFLKTVLTRSDSVSRALTDKVQRNIEAIAKLVSKVGDEKHQTGAMMLKDMSHTSGPIGLHHCPKMLAAKDSGDPVPTIDAIASLVASAAREHGGGFEQSVIISPTLFEVFFPWNTIQIIEMRCQMIVFHRQSADRIYGPEFGQDFDEKGGIVLHRLLGEDVIISWGLMQRNYGLLVQSGVQFQYLDRRIKSIESLPLFGKKSA